MLPTDNNFNSIPIPSLDLPGGNGSRSMESDIGSDDLDELTGVAEVLRTYCPEVPSVRPETTAGGSAENNLRISLSQSTQASLNRERILTPSLDLPGSNGNITSVSGSSSDNDQNHFMGQRQTTDSDYDSEEYSFCFAYTSQLNLNSKRIPTRRVNPQTNLNSARIITPRVATQPTSDAQLPCSEKQKMYLAKLLKKNPDSLIYVNSSKENCEAKFYIHNIMIIYQKLHHGLINAKLKGQYYEQIMEIIIALCGNNPSTDEIFNKINSVPIIVNLTNKSLPRKPRHYSELEKMQYEGKIMVIFARLEKRYEEVPY